MEELSGSVPSLDSRTVDDILSCWKTYDSLHSGRIRNALDFFFYAWRAYYLEHACLNLSIALESLFSPESSTEVSHQIAYFASRFWSREPNERENLYRLVKAFYTQRSRLVHGAAPKWEKLRETTPAVFRFCSQVLKRLLLDSNLAGRLNNSKLREGFLNELLFE